MGCSLIKEEKRGKDERLKIVAWRGKRCSDVLRLARIFSEALSVSETLKFNCFNNRRVLFLMGIQCGSLYWLGKHKQIAPCRIWRVSMWKEPWFYSTGFRSQGFLFF